MLKLKMVTAIALLSLVNFKALAFDQKVVENALGFMMGGDQMLDEVTSYSFDGCKAKIKIVTDAESDMWIQFNYNFDIAYWNSERTFYKKGRPVYALNGDKGVYEGTHSDNLDSFVLNMNGFSVGARNIAEFEIPGVTLDRFMNAAKDLKKQCPGKQRSAY